MRDTWTYRIAELSVHLGIAPSEFINMDSSLLAAIYDVLKKQAEQQKNASRGRGNRRL